MGIFLMTVVVSITSVPACYGLVFLLIAAVGAICSSRVAISSSQGDMYLEEACVAFETPSKSVGPAATNFMRMSAWQAGLAASVILFVLGLFW